MELADPAVYDRLTGKTKVPVRALLRAELKNAFVSVYGPTQSNVFYDT